MLNVWSVYPQYHNSRASKQNKELLGFVYVPIPYIPLKLQNEYARHVSISYYFLTIYVLSSKNSLNCSTTFGSSVCQRCLSWVHSIWLCSLTVPWPTMCHCWGYSLNNSVLIIAYSSSLTWRSLGALYNKVGSQIPASHLVGFDWVSSNYQCNHLSHWAIFPSF